MNRTAVTETFVDVKDDIESVVKRFTFLRGGEFDEHLGDAYLIFLKAYEQYNPSRGSFRGWIKYKIYKDLHEILRNKMAKNNRLPRVNLTLEEVKDDEDSMFHLTDFLQSLTVSQDAASVLRFIVRPPKDLRYLIRQDIKPTVALKTFLRDMGWQASEVRNCLDEIRRAMEARYERKKPRRRSKPRLAASTGRS